MSLHPSMRRLIYSSNYSIRTPGFPRVNRKVVYGLRSTTTNVRLPARVNQALASSYDPANVEADWYKWWEESGLFRPQHEPSKDHPPFSVALPPPNITGSLHLGHALTITIQDILVRWRRMRGDSVVWIPGADHAGIATQTVVEKRLMKSQGKTLKDLGREAFLEEIWKWNREYGNRINEQLRRTGASLDWSRTVFTMDEVRIKAVNEAFVRLYEAGLIYRSTKLVHWCPFLQSVISDIEVDLESIEGRTSIKIPRRVQHDSSLKSTMDEVEVGVLYTIAYPIRLGDGSISSLPVSTTRPETILGDSALAIHPDDTERIVHLGTSVAINPITGKTMPIIADPILVDRTLGTGVVKITPLCDHDDFACAQRHNLEHIPVITEDGVIESNFGSEWRKLTRWEARVKVINILRDQGLVLKEESHSMRIARCSRTGDVIEPLLKPQWYINTHSMAKASAESVRDGKIRLIPSHFANDWFRWMEHDVRDWCISRQLVWGHQIPAWRLAHKDSNTQHDVSEYWFIARTEEEALSQAHAYCQKNNYQFDSFSFKRDDDVLDTWFSSGIYPLSIFGWPDSRSVSPDALFDTIYPYYPLSVLETGSDILFFWVARMTMLCTFLSGRIPFNDVFLHQLVRDSEGRKMSKSLGNVIDPLQVIEGVSLETLITNIQESNLVPKEIERLRVLIPRATNSLRLEFPSGIPPCGSDALRLTLAQYTRQGKPINLDTKKIITNRQFGNKIWQAAKFTLMHLQQASGFQLAQDAIVSELTSYINAQNISNNFRFTGIDLFMLSRLRQTCTIANNSLYNYQFSDAVGAVTTHFLNDICDLYIEYIKPSLWGDDRIRKETVLLILRLLMDYSLRLLHPVMPFITEELWQRVSGHNDQTSIMISSYPLESDLPSIDPMLFENDRLLPHIQIFKCLLPAIRSQKQALGVSAVATTLHLFLPNNSFLNLMKTYEREVLYLTKLTEIKYEVVESLQSVLNTSGVHLVRDNDANSLIFSAENEVAPSLSSGLAPPVMAFILESEAKDQGVKDSASILVEIISLEKELSKTRTIFEKLCRTRENPQYETKVPAAVQIKDKEKLVALQERIQNLESEVSYLKDRCGTSPEL